MSVGSYYCYWADFPPKAAVIASRFYRSGIPPIMPSPAEELGF